MKKRYRIIKTKVGREFLCDTEDKDIKVGDLTCEKLMDGSWDAFEIHTVNDIYDTMIREGHVLKVVEVLL